MKERIQKLLLISKKLQPIYTISSEKLTIDRNIVKYA